MFTIVDGDLLEAPKGYICHQTNCISDGPAAGLARILFDKFPGADTYANRKENDRVGTIVVRGRVINMMGQYYPGSTTFAAAKRERLGWFAECLSEMAKLYTAGPFNFPWRIGCGIAGGDWGMYIEMLKNFESAIDSDVVIYKL